MVATRRLWLRACVVLFMAVVILALPPSSTRAASGTITFVNLSNAPVYLAYSSYQPYSSNSGGLAVITEEGWWFQGWWKIGPGESRAFSTAHATEFYVEDDKGNPLRWSGRTESIGYVKNAKFNQFISRARWTAETQRLANQGFRRVTFHTFTSGLWSISGNAYRLQSQHFSFSIESREPKYDTKYFSVPGQVVDYSYNADYWNARDIRWSKEGTYVSVRAYVWGSQVRVGAGRRPGYYRGNATVWYTTRR